MSTDQEQKDPAPDCRDCGHSLAIHAVGVGCQAARCQCLRSGLSGEAYTAGGAEGQARNGGGRGFAPGNPGRPAGSKNRAPSIKRLMKKVVTEREQEVENLIAKLLLGGVGSNPEGEAILVDPQVQLRMLKMITDHLDGRPVETTKLVGADGGPVATIDWSKVPMEKLLEMRDTLRAAAKAEGSDE